MSSISGVSGLSNAWANANTQRSQMQAKIFAKVDANGSGGFAVCAVDLPSGVSKAHADIGDARQP